MESSDPVGLALPLLDDDASEEEQLS